MTGISEVRLLNEEIARAISKGVGNISTSKKVYNGYKPKRIAEIMKRQGYTITDYSEYDTYLDFGKKFKICLFPDLIDKLNLIKACYFSYNKLVQDIDIIENFESNNIEGACIDTLDETLTILRNKSVRDKKSSMIIGYSKAVEYVQNHKDAVIDFEYCKSLNEEIVHYYSDADRIGIRDNTVYVGKVSEVVFTPCDCSLIEPLLKLLFSNWLDGYDPFIRSSIIHFLFVWIHPFFDGNGRTIRMLNRELLVRYGLTKFENIPVSRYIRDMSSGYYKSIRYSEEDYDITHFILYMLDVYEKCLTEGV